METETIITENSQPAVVSYNLSTSDLDRFAKMKKEEGRLEALAEIERQRQASFPTLSRKEAMAKLGISESTIILWGKRGLLRKVRHGHACFYFQEDVDRILRCGTDR